MADWVLVHWIDITSCEQPWMTKEEAGALKPAEMWSAGVVVRQDSECLVVAGTLDPVEESYGNVNAIPRGVIISTRKLTPAEITTEPSDPAVRDAGLG